MRLYIFLVFLVLSASAIAQPAQSPPPTPDQQASDYMINQLTNEKKNLLTQIATSNQQINDLNKQIADLNKQLIEAKKVAAAEPPK